jgi:hypothetical protein
MGSAVIVPPVSLEKVWANIALLEFRRQLVGAIAVEKMVDGLVDEYEDETGIDTVGSTGETYDSANDLYSPTLTTDIKSLLNFDGVDGSTTFTDDTGKIWTPAGAAQIDTADSKFGGASGLFDGVDSKISTPNTGDHDFGAGNFTVAFWMKRDGSQPDYTCICGKWQAGATDWYVALVGNKIEFYIYAGGTYMALQSADVIPDLTWTHVAIVRHGATSWKLYIDGVQSGAEYVTNRTIASTAVSTTIGAFASASGWFKGWIDSLVINKGSALYSGDFALPTQPYYLYAALSLISNAYAAAAQPAKARIFLFQEDVSAVTLNTDLLAYASRDGGTTWTQIVLAALGVYDTSKNILGGVADLAAQPAGTSMKYKIGSANGKNFKLHGTGLLWQ